MEHQADEVEAVEGIMSSFRSESKDSKHRDTSHRAGRWDR